MIAAGGDRWYEIREEKRTAALNILTHSMGYDLGVDGGRAQYIVYVCGDEWVPGCPFPRGIRGGEDRGGGGGTGRNHGISL